MTTGEVMNLLQQSLMVMLQVGGPIVVSTLVVGLIVSVLQAATQINEATLTFVPKLIVVAAVLVVLGPWMLESIVGFAARIFTAAGTVAK